MRVESANVLNILTQNNKVIAKMANEGLLEQPLEKSQVFSAKNIIDGLIDGLLAGNKNNMQIENGLKNLSFFKSLGSVSQNFEQLLKLLSKTPNTENEHKFISGLIGNFDGFDDEKLKNFFQKSGIFMESKLLKDLNAADDLKAVLLKMQQDSDKNIKELTDKILTQIDYYQLLSIVSNSNWIYLPLNWDDFESGKIGFKKRGDRSFYCEIELILKSYDDIKLKVLMQDDLLNLIFESKNQIFLDDAKAFQKDLKYELSKLGFFTQIDFKSLADDDISKIFENDDFWINEVNVRA